MDEKKLKVAMLWVLVVSLVLIAIVAVGNWQLYSRVEKIETTLGLRATPQSQQKSLQPEQPKNYT